MIFTNARLYASHRLVYITPECQKNFSDGDEARVLERFQASISAQNPNYQLIFNRFCQDQSYHILES